jgi:hypothetical protein
MAAGGGGFFRLLPYSFSSWAIGRVNRSEERPRSLLFPPLGDRSRPAASAGSAPAIAPSSLQQLSVMEPKLLKLLRAHRWGRTDAVVQAERARLQ